MENTMAVSTPTEVSTMDPVKPTVPDISTDPLDFQKEMAKIAAEQGMKIENGQVVPVDQMAQTLPPVQEQTQTQVAATQPVTQQPPQAEAQPVEIPKKFQTQDGQVDLAKVEKSTVNAEAALRKYEAIEAELRKKQNEVAQLRQAPSVPQATQTQPQFNVPQITPEQINDALTNTKNPGKVLLDLLAIRDQAVRDQAIAEAQARVSHVEARIEAGQRRTELQEIADKDPWVFSEDGIRELSDRRNAKPYLNQAPEPWLAAYRDYKADQALKPNYQVQTTNPTPGAAKAPPAPVTGGNRATAPQGPTLAQLSQNPAALNKYLDSLPNDAARQAFFRAAIPGAR